MAVPATDTCQKKTAASAVKLPACGFVVNGGKKGNVPISVEKRPKGKKVTIISNVQGSAKSLLSALSSLLGTGGTTRQESSGKHWTVEVQGDQADRVGAALAQLGCLRGVTKEAEKREKNKVVEVATRVCAYDKFLRRGESNTTTQCGAPEHTYTFLAGAECHKWHGDWIYCRGQCVKADFDDVWVGGELEMDSGGATTVIPPRPPASLAELNLALRELGMFAESGQAIRFEREQKGKNGKSLEEYRRTAVLPGSRTIGLEEQSVHGSNRTRRRSLSRAVPRGASSNKRPADEGGGLENKSTQRSRSYGPAIPLQSRPAPPPVKKQGTFRCSLCGSVFGLYRTLKLHARSVHQGSETAALAASRSSMQSLCRQVGRMSEHSTSGAGVVTPSKRVAGHLAEKDEKRFQGASMDLGSVLEAKLVAAAAPLASARTKSVDVQRVASEPSGSSCRRRSRRHDGRGPTTAPAAEASADARVAVMQSECPLCLESFPLESFEAHVNVCLDACGRDVIDSSGSDVVGSSFEERELSVVSGGQVSSSAVSVPCSCKVSQDFTPVGDARDVQLCVRRGETLFVEWKQPEDEGGFWAYCHPTGEPERLGYVPLNCLACGKLPCSSAKAEDEQTAPTPRVSLEDAGHDCRLPEEWLETFLMLDLPQDRAESFWKAFEHLKQEMPMASAWLGALRGVCDALSVSPAASSRGNQRSSAALEVPTAFCAGERSRSSRRSGDGGAAVHANSNIAPTTEALSHRSPLAEDTYRILTRWEPVNDAANVQIEVQPGDEVFVEWRQPSTEGGFWAYGWVRGKPTKQMGYFPLNCLASTSSPPISTVVGRAPLPAATIFGGGGTTCCERTSGRASLADCTAASRSLAGCDQRRRRSFGHGAKTVCTAATRDEHVACPMCMAKFPSGEIEIHAERCVAKRELGLTEVMPKDPITKSVEVAHSDDVVFDSFRDGEFSSDVQAWAGSQLSKLADRFCVAKLDTAVACTALAVCKTANELQSEAVLLMGDNQPVKNFAAELWRRRAPGVQAAPRGRWRSGARAA
eukprot:TRINITY_DN10138_c0_g1_i1.p1 TRINITY_DN10138_c0_g1~~TRINITY_DN10138_c0_g1_i1.p1  ORF type:complete len:1040 (-),score=136.68 TRINITY_DN10138_c0_g1_i1:185-3304(-)